MKDYSNRFIIISTLIAVVGLYLFFLKKEEVTQELAIMNALGGGAGMAIGLIIYRKILRNTKS
ncbi:hypothetical protein EQP59_07240 [Ornithobacterium rhinotracheale]|uniref:Uncharacterized protein n=1 Tax=Ornithobacterium rhinotracheale TaxID=28251 RepID=A0A410JSM3_ORNRH|nr:hypothetical protein [Ornithobacterium rhinotracheale]MRJ08732.1 hypothetical protein [Ornithobacterium rhinotracheale]QAR31140.1 hypothetical protein EQP59_07240 [Ornithobacterium rhinotracheale]UOH77124.1 hypothetical protein MT996_07845 [Ornithobacterium rhinotracheale]